MVGKWVGGGEPNPACAFYYFWGHTVESMDYHYVINKLCDKEYESKCNVTRSICEGGTVTHM